MLTVLRNNCDLLFVKTTLIPLKEVETEIICCTFVNFQEVARRLSFFSSMKIWFPSVTQLHSTVILLPLAVSFILYSEARHASIKTPTAVVRYFHKPSLFFCNSCKNDSLSFESLLSFIVLFLWFAQVV